MQNEIFQQLDEHCFPWMLLWNQYFMYIEENVTPKFMLLKLCQKGILITIDLKEDGTFPEKIAFQRGFLIDYLKHFSIACNFLCNFYLRYYGLFNACI